MILLFLDWLYLHVLADTSSVQLAEISA